ncbi:ABC transporter permease [Paenibacillus rigui]|uniref:ABC transporter permease n=1 Tax=Paenibacillus rigui TaxID=554312 RepID=A0A229UP88_9BACL|nr:ABC transporter permease [Paenibacillus rigui]OXM85286.1 hypothetical protein CF651_17010 [Paenibacillus rigui]
MAGKGLYEQRQAHFAKEIRPYVHYAIQGIAMTALIVFFAASIGYKQFLQWVTPDFPWKPAAAGFMLPFLALGRIRTYLREADTIFLLPQQEAMMTYIGSARRKAMVFQSAAVTAAWLAVWPVYAKVTGSGAGAFLALLLAWVLFKAVLLYGKWTEQQMQESRTRLGWSLLRWLWAGTAAYALFSMGPAYGLLLLSIGSLVYLAALRLPRKFTVHWNYLIELELRHQASLYRVLNWFVDVPPLRARARNIKGLPRISSRIPFQKRFSYHYLYSLVFFRSELLGILFRLLVIGVLLIAFITNDWARIVIYVVFSLAGALQLSDLKRYYREHLWHRIYPLPEGLKKQAVGTVRFLVHFIALLVLAVPLLLNPAFSAAWSLGLLLACTAASWLYHRFK